MYSDEIQRLIDRSSMFMFISVIASLLSVIMIVIAADFLSNDLPPSIAVKYFQVLTFPGLNVVTGLVAASSIMAVIGGFLIYMARSSLNRREFRGLPSIIATSLVLILIALISVIRIYIIYQYYVGFSGMMGPLLPGTFSLILSIILLVITLVLTLLALMMSNEIRRRYSPRRVRRRQPPPSPPPQV
ncbi:hypothetical protein [Vulcanisaeta sp. JCM 14467]|uniref:hypothetical protein n=1 Tax=Vulcanisaeta sp. JCM 14467 TaxID=1295370 RepID=UPI0006CF70FD|nr:hypothetical protein [Vulcanisaeta sp. JCM 14467]